MEGIFAFEKKISVSSESFADVDFTVFNGLNSTLDHLVIWVPQISSKSLLFESTLHQSYTQSLFFFFKISNLEEI